VGETATPPPAAAVLPAPLYFLSGDNEGNSRLWRVDVDGINLTLIRDCCVKAYAVSSATGQVAYVADDESTLVIVDASGGEVSVDIAAVGYPEQFQSALAWSPDGSQVALGGENGVWLYAPGSDELTQLADSPDNAAAIRPLSYDAWSPDGRTLLVARMRADLDADLVGYLVISSGELQMTQIATGRRFSWSPDSRSVYVSTNFYGMMGIFPSLSVMTPEDNEITSLIMSESTDEGLTARYVEWAQVGPDGLLYYFYGEGRIEPSRDTGEVSMVRSSTDGVTDRVPLRDDVHIGVNEVLWARDMSLALIVGAEDWPEDLTGAITLLPTTGQETAVVTPFTGYGLQWGKESE
jgi:hypothetical protein